MLETHGILVVPGVVGAAALEAARAELGRRLLTPPADVAVLRRGTEIYAARNLLGLWPEVTRLLDPVRRFLPAGAGIVRSLYFDKPPRAEWSVPAHRDQTIAVQQTTSLPAGFRAATRKHGVLHLEAPIELLDRMLTIRLHLDDADDANGALWVAPGSHLTSGEFVPEQLLAVNAGDAVLMRPRLIHASRSNQSGRRRRVLHFELAPRDALPAPLDWRWFTRVSGSH